MTKRFVCSILYILTILLFTAWSIYYVQSRNDDIIENYTDQIALGGPSLISGLSNAQEHFRHNISPISKTNDYVESNPSGEFPFRIYVTPEDQAIKALATQVNGIEEAYKLAVKWTYVSEQKLSHVADKWLTPHEFLTNTPYYPGNPLKGEVVSDCEEQAYTLVSLIRAEGIGPEEVRVALGLVKFSNEAAGHAWVELLINGHWRALDPSWGPYWDDKAEKLVRRQGFPFNYYTNHIYPVIQVWNYYNDIYYIDLRYDSGNAPASWR